MRHHLRKEPGTGAVIAFFLAFLVAVAVKLAIIGFLLWLAYTLVMGLVG